MPVTKSMAPQGRSIAEFRREHYAQRDQIERETILPLGAALIVIVLSSLGLWWASCR